MNQTNQRHDRPRNLTGGTLYATRPRAIRPGDRVKDTEGTPFPENIARNYPGAHLFGTVISTGNVTATVRFDDGVECTVLLRELQLL